MQLHFVIPPPTDIKRDTRAFTPADMAVLEGFIDGLSVMTYDFSGPNQPGPNAPASWVKKCLQNLPKSKGGAASNVLLGLNFYGNDFILPQGTEAQGTWLGLHAINHLIVIIEFNQVYLLDVAGPL